MQGDVRVLFDKGADHRRQGITCLGVGGGNRQGAFLLVGELLGDLLNAFDFAQNLASGVDDALAGRGDAGQVLAAAGENFHAQFVFQQADLFADAGLRGVEALRGGRYVEVVMRDFPDVAQLLELHKNPSKQKDSRSGYRRFI